MRIPGGGKVKAIVLATGNNDTQSGVTPGTSKSPHPRVESPDGAVVIKEIKGEEEAAARHPLAQQAALLHRGGRRHVVAGAEGARPLLPLVLVLLGRIHHRALCRCARARGVFSLV